MSKLLSHKEWKNWYHTFWLCFYKKKEIIALHHSPSLLKKGDKSKFLFKKRWERIGGIALVIFSKRAKKAKERFTLLKRVKERFTLFCQKTCESPNPAKYPPKCCVPKCPLKCCVPKCLTKWCVHLNVHRKF